MLYDWKTVAVITHDWSDRNHMRRTVIILIQKDGMMIPWCSTGRPESCFVRCSNFDSLGSRSATLTKGASLGISAPMLGRVRRPARVVAKVDPLEAPALAGYTLVVVALQRIAIMAGLRWRGSSWYCVLCACFVFVVVCVHRTGRIEFGG